MPFGATPAQDLAVAWRFQSSYGVQQGGAPLVLAGDRVIGLANNTLYAADLFSGREISNPNGFPYAVQRLHPDDSSPLPIVSSNGLVFFPELDPNGNTVLRALQLTSGMPLPPSSWAAPAIQVLQSIAAVDDLVLTVQQDQNGNTLVSAVRAVDGSVAWGPLTVTNLTSGIVGYGDGAIFFVSGQQLYALNTDFGDTRFPALANGSTPPAYNINEQTAPLVGSGIAICVGDQIWGFDVKTGAEIWAWQSSGDSFNGNASPALSGDGSLMAAISDNYVLSVLDVRTGALKWSRPVGYSGTPVIDRDRIFVAGIGQAAIASFDLATGEAENFALAPATQYAGGISPTPSAVGNGHLFVQTNDGSILAKAFGTQAAAHFNGVDTHVDITADGAQFDFGTGDFTIEAWVRSSEGGEILCGYPTAPGGTGAGFRVNLGPDGRLRFAVTDLHGQNQDLAQGLPTTATDGLWHHIAVVRRGGDVSFFTDGIESSPAWLLVRGGKSIHRNGYALDGKGRARRDVLTQPPPPAPIAVAGNNALFIGWNYYGVIAKLYQRQHFIGLMREVRLWNKALDVDALLGRMNKVIGPKGAPRGSDPRAKATEPQLLGNWHLDDSYDTDQPVAIENDVLGHEYAATFHNAASVVTDLDLDMSAFPYPLDEVHLQWPYAGFWSVRGEHDLSTPPVLSSDGVICFGTNNSLYGVSRLNGTRKWSYVTPGHSGAVALGKAFYACTAERGLVALDTATGSATEVAAFEAMPKTLNAGAHLAAPAVSGSSLAAAAQNGKIFVANPVISDAPVTFSTGQYPGDLQYAGGKVCCIAGAASRQLFICDVTTKQVSALPVDSEFFTLCGSRVFFTQNGRLVGIDTSKKQTDPGYRSVAMGVDGRAITGLAGSEDGNILVVSTSNGTLWGLSLATLAFRWSTAIPDGAANGPDTARGRLNAPVIAGHIVYCSSRSGAVAAVDTAGGRIVGLFFERTAIITPVLVQAGTAFFGCAPAAPTAPLDGALHSVVFGETMALRLGVDNFAKTAPIGYADIASAETIVAGASGECCVEAWINAWTGAATSGEILSVRPAGSGNFGARLILDGQGRIHFIGHDKKPHGTWEGFGAQTLDPAPVRDGQWHHIGASRAGAQDIRIYVDGKAQTMAAVTPDTLAVSDIGNQFQARIGAPAYQAQPASGNSFRGMIAEVRLWDTYLPADQISKRMHTKLRGDEFSLAAYWDFATFAVHDGSRNGYDGTLAAGGGASFSLCDLTFEMPDYPDLTTAAKIIQVGEALVPGGKPGPLNNTIYELTINCSKADKSPLANALLRLWYVKHQGEAQPGQITLTTSGKNPPDRPAPAVVPTLSVPPVSIDQEGTSQAGFVVYTDARGQAVVRITTADPNHGPSLDLSADFMPANERIHVNVLIDNQALARPAPPSLAVQTKLIQDYHYSAGSKIDDTRSRETYRAVITASNADGTPRHGEWLEICTTDATSTPSIEVNGTSYSITSQNSQAFQTDENGQLAVVLAATDLKAADLSVWAGFMHQGERVTIAMDQDAHGSLAAVQGDAMKDPNRLINWKKKNPDGTDGSERGPLLKGDYQDHADDVAGAIRHVASSAQSSPPPKPGRAALRANLNSTRFIDMRQPFRQVNGDQGQVLRTLKHVARRAPVTPEAVLASIQNASPGSVGFFLDFGSGDAASLSFGHFTAAQAATHMGQPTAEAYALHAVMRLGFSFGSLWDDVKHGVESAVDDIATVAKKIALEVSDVVTVAIHYVDEVVHVVVASIKDAMEIIGNFLAKLALMIVDMIKFLLFLFNWEAILETHKILRDVMLNSLSFLLDNGKIGQTVLNAIEDVIAKLPGGDEAVKQFQLAAAQTSSQDRVASAPDRAADYSQASGVPGKMAFSKMKERRDGITAAGFATLDSSSALAALVPGLMVVLADVVTKSPGDLGGVFLDFAKGTENAVLAEARTKVADALGAANAALQPQNLTPLIHVPFLSELYKWITGDDLTLLDVTCLVLAIPVNLVYGVISGLRHFNEDEKNLPDLINAAPRWSALHAQTRAMRLGAGDPITPSILPFTSGVEALLVIFRIFSAAAGTVLDLSFVASFKAPNDTLRQQAKVMKSLFGIGTTVLTQLSLASKMNDWLAKQGYPVDPTTARAAVYASMAISSLGDIWGLISAVKGSDPVRPGNNLSNIDKLEYEVQILKGLGVYPGASVLIIFNSVLMTQAGSAPSPIAAYWLLQISNMIQMFSTADDFLYTQAGAKQENYNELVYEESAKRRLGLQLLSLATQIAAVAIMQNEDDN